MVAVFNRARNGGGPNHRNLLAVAAYYKESSLRKHSVDAEVCIYLSFVYL